MEAIVVETGHVFVLAADRLLPVQKAFCVTGRRFRRRVEVETTARSSRQAGFPAAWQSAGGLHRFTAIDTNVPCHVRFSCRTRNTPVCKLTSIFAISMNNLSILITKIKRTPFSVLWHGWLAEGDPSCNINSTILQRETMEDQD